MYSFVNTIDEWHNILNDVNNNFKILNNALIIAFIFCGYLSPFLMLNVFISQN